MGMGYYSSSVWISGGSLWSTSSSIGAFASYPMTSSSAGGYVSLEPQTTFTDSSVQDGIYELQSRSRRYKGRPESAWFDYGKEQDVYEMGSGSGHFVTVRSTDIELMKHHLQFAHSLSSGMVDHRLVKITNDGIEVVDETIFPESE